MSTHNRLRRTFHRIANLGLLIAITATGLLGFGTAAFAHANIVYGVASCASPLGTGYQVTWNVSNDWNLSETAQVVAATGGLSSLSSLSLTIPASGNGSGGKGLLPYSSVTTVQSLPATASGAVVVNVSSVYADQFTTINAGEINLPENCSPPTTTVPVTTTTMPAPVTTTTVAVPVANAPEVPSSTVPSADVDTNVGANPVEQVVVAARRQSPPKRPLHPTLLVNELSAAKPATPVVRQAAFTG